MKKTYLMLTAFALSVVMVACGSKKEEKGEGKEGENTEETANNEEAESPAMEEFKSEAGKFSINFK